MSGRAVVVICLVCLIISMMLLLFAEAQSGNLFTGS